MCTLFIVWCLAHTLRKINSSWIVTIPFWIMHVDLWSPSHHDDDQGNKIYAMNSMLDITQFIISSPAADISSVHLAQWFMSDVVLMFGMCYIVVVDAGSLFKGIFMVMYNALYLIYRCLSRGNHRGSSVERYHQFINKRFPLDIELLSTTMLNNKTNNTLFQ